MEMFYFLKISLLIICVSSESAPNDAPPEADENPREGREINEESFDGPIDLNDQLQNLNYGNTQGNNDNEPPHNSWRDLVPGTPGLDYPSLTKIPETSFSCDGKNPGGYYADVETGCQVFHICNIGGFKSSFLCPEGSIFNQRYFVCDWWYGFRCDEAISLYPEHQTSDNNSPQSNIQTSEEIDNYEPILLHNDNPNKDLTSASTGDDRLRNENQREILNYEERNLGDDYANKEVQQSASRADRQLSPKIQDSEENYEEKKTNRDIVPRGFANRQKLRRNTVNRDSQIAEARADGYSNFRETSGDAESTSTFKVQSGKRDEEIRYVPAL